MFNKTRRHHGGIRFGLVVLFTLLFTLAMIVTSHAKTIEDVIPADSFLYLKIQNLAACREAIGSSENWKAAAEFITASPSWAPMNQMLQMVPMFTGTDIPGLLNTFLEDQVALTVSAGAEGLLVGLVVQNAGKAATAEQTFTTLTQTLSSMGNEVNVAEDTYRDITYHTLSVGGQQLTYGNLDADLFLVGLTPASFKKVVDVYRAEQASIGTNAAYRSVVEMAGPNEVFAFVDMTGGSSYLQLLLPQVISRELAGFRTLGYTLDLLRPGGGHRLYGHLNTEGQETLISRLQETTAMQTTRGLTGTEEFFLAFPTQTAALFWQTVLGRQTPSEVRNFLFPPTAELQAALAGELTCTIALADLGSHSTLYKVIKDTTDGVLDSVGIEFEELNVGFLFIPEAPEKWKAVFQGILEKCAVQPLRQVNYRGVTCNIVDIPGSLHYGTVDDIFLLAFSEKQFQTLVDSLLAAQVSGGLQQRLAAFATPPAACLQFDFGALIRASAPNNSSMPAEVVASTGQMAPLFASLVVQEETASLDIRHAPEETGSEAMAKLAPFLFLTFATDRTSGQ